MYENIARERLLLFDLPDKRTDRIKAKKKKKHVVPIITHLGNRDLQCKIKEVKDVTYCYRSRRR
jgi:hypothetical protein